MNQKTTKFDKTEITLVTGLLLLIVGLLVISPFLPDTTPREIRNILTRQGHDVENIDFEFVKNASGFRGRIFQSSEPIYYDGEYISKWIVKIISFSNAPSFFPRYSVSPYM